jgi:hypothetical protein
MFSIVVVSSLKAARALNRPRRCDALRFVLPPVSVVLFLRVANGGTFDFFAYYPASEEQSGHHAVFVTETHSSAADSRHWFQARGKLNWETEIAY